MILNLDDFRGPDGKIDWDAYHRAEVAIGDACRRCGQSTILQRLRFDRDSEPAGPRLCGQCQELGEAKEVLHDRLIRCPSCAHAWDPQKAAWDGDCQHVFTEGFHSVSCPKCEHDFEVSTLVSYQFRSPAVK